MNRSPGEPNPTIFSVARLNREARQLLENGLPNLWVSGEISNLARPGSGHMYFSLKDADAQVQCAMFRRENRKLKFPLEAGLQVVVQARVSIYEPQGRYQLIIEHMEEAGEGQLQRRFEELKRKLDAEGLFDESTKQPLPDLPVNIGVITSPTGAAIRDILNILKRRYPLAAVTIYPTRVQGKQAELEIVAALNSAVEHGNCDVLIVARGGGSLEDLWAFNEEVLARAIYACPVPVVSGVGHEVDVTIADLVADQRAPTPSGAAELIVPDTDELLRTLTNLERRLTLTLQRQWSVIKQQTGQLTARLARVQPGAILQQIQQRADELTRQLVRAMHHQLEQQQYSRGALNQRLLHAAPAARVARNQNRLQILEQRLTTQMRRQLEQQHQRFALLTSNLNTVSPLATLERGYAIVSQAGKENILRDAEKIKVGQEINVRLATGQLDARVTGKTPGANDKEPD